jgi:hypothetical protein
MGKSFHDRREDRGGPNLISPAVGSTKNAMSLTVCLSSSNATLPRFSSARPYIAGSTPCRLRLSSRTPSVCSRSPIAFDTADWVTLSC